MNLMKTLLLLGASNVFMTFAWYAHLRNLNNKVLWVAILASWGIAFFEYIFQVPANRIGFNEAGLSLAQLKILQEVITLSIFIPFAIYYMRQPISLNFLWASFCMVGAVYFIFR
ncbi:DMT family protein [Candidatus Berkiella aquae]|uniref:DMT family protein n=1 Tax=Candidatus Berkiella aquae TaxID=295108 RepID=A0A0Q9YS10_9GAMM|nr:DMT family protein [Candidatus Berkiella aquae]MCS5712225.1 DMT family protein [Candidatus Berkiella aquae]